MSLLISALETYQKDPRATRYTLRLLRAMKLLVTFVHVVNSVMQKFD